MAKILKNFKFRDISACVLSAVFFAAGITEFALNRPLPASDFIIAGIIMLDLAIINFTLLNFKRHIVLFVFAFCYNVLILSRVFTVWITNHGALYTTMEAGTPSDLYKALVLIFLSLGLVFAAYRAFAPLFKNREEYIDRHERPAFKSDSLIPIISVIAQLSVYILFAFAFYTNLKTAQFVYDEGYLNSYKTYPTIPYQIRALSGLFLPAYALFLATCPSKKKLIAPTALFLIISVLSLLSGRRNYFTRDILMLVIYLVMRDDFRKAAKSFFTKLRVLAGSGIGLALVYLLQGMRSDFKFALFYPFSFLYEQGSIIRVIVKTVMHKNIFSDNPARYFFYPLELQFRNGYVGRIFFHTEPIIEVQTAAFVSTTYNYAHKLTYYVDPARYLNGGGFGSSYIADGYILAGVLGVVIVSILTGLIIRFMPSLLARSVFVTAFGLMLIRYVIYMPRNFFISFIPEIFSILNLSFYLGIFILAVIIRQLIKVKTDLAAGKAEKGGQL